MLVLVRGTASQRTQSVGLRVKVKMRNLLLVVVLVVVLVLLRVGVVRRWLLALEVSTAFG